MSGTRVGTLRLDDGRTDSPVSNWNFQTTGTEVEVESVFWDRQNEQSAYVLTSDGKTVSYFNSECRKPNKKLDSRHFFLFIIGKLRFLDTRQPGEVITTIQAHENGETGGLSLSLIDGLLATVGGEVN